MLPHDQYARALSNLGMMYRTWSLVESASSFHHFDLIVRGPHQRWRRVSSQHFFTTPWKRYHQSRYNNVTSKFNFCASWAASNTVLLSWNAKLIKWSVWLSKWELHILLATSSGMSSFCGIVTKFVTSCNNSWDSGVCFDMLWGRTTVRSWGWNALSAPLIAAALVPAAPEV